MQDYSVYPKVESYLQGAERKCEIMTPSGRYIVKFQTKSDIGLIYNHVSEYLGSNIFRLLGVDAQETMLGKYEGQNVVLMKNFLSDGEILTPFNDVGESTIEADREQYRYTYEDITDMLRANKKSTNVNETIERFWDMYVVDALIGNFDRHGGNWGFIKKNDKYRLAPVYDNGSCLYPRLNTEERIEAVLASEEELNKRIFMFPTSQIVHGRKKSSYYDIINSVMYSACNDAILRIVPRVNFDEISNLIDSVENLIPIHNHFYKFMLRRRYEQILLPAYERIRKGN